MFKVLRQSLWLFGRCVKLLIDSTFGNGFRDNIKLFALDVDGTYSDGIVYWGSNGDEMLALHTRDTHGLMLASTNLHVILLSGRTSPAAISRFKNLNFDSILGCSDKLKALEEKTKELGIKMGEVAFISDDTCDIPALRGVGLSLCPADAHVKVKEVVDIVLTSDAGRGAVREALSYIVDHKEI
jgi:YrbI family 3-deoxy-D-manno-octulosonate 8-phosphate phosphatase